MKLLDINKADEALMYAGKGIEHWFRFFQVVGKSDLLNEDSIKYPLIEYLIADGCDSIQNIKLEDNHPVFTSREVDLISKERNGRINYCIEFKMANKFTMSKLERQRIIDDIFRLFYVHNNKSVDSYFIVAGKTVDFISEFRNVIDKHPGQRGRPKKKTTTGPEKLLMDDPCGFFSDKLLSFNMLEPKKTILINDEKVELYKNHYEEFKKEYLKDEYSHYELPSEINTYLKYITEIKTEDYYGNTPAMVAIWKIY